MMRVEGTRGASADGTSNLLCILPDNLSEIRVHVVEVFGVINRALLFPEDDCFGDAGCNGHILCKYEYVGTRR